MISLRISEQSEEPEENPSCDPLADAIFLEADTFELDFRFENTESEDAMTLRCESEKRRTNNTAKQETDELHFVSQD